MTRHIKPTPESIVGCLERLLDANDLLLGLLREAGNGEFRVPRPLGESTYKLLSEAVKNLNQVAWAVELTVDHLSDAKRTFPKTDEVN